MNVSRIQPAGVAELIREVNDSHEAHEDQYLRIREASDLAVRSEGQSRQATATAQRAKIAHEAIQAEQPRRRAALPRQVIIAMITVALDGLACYFAAQALDGSQDVTLIWTLIFLAVLGSGEVALDYYQDKHRKIWSLLIFFLSGFVVILGVLRFSYLATIGTGDALAATAGAVLFTAATAVFLFLGYRALRAAETPQAWRARVAALRAQRVAQSAAGVAERDEKNRDQLVSAYLRQVRRHALHTCPAGQVLIIEAAAREHLGGRMIPL